MYKIESLFEHLKNDFAANNPTSALRHKTSQKKLCLQAAAATNRRKMPQEILKTTPYVYNATSCKAI